MRRSRRKSVDGEIPAPFPIDRTHPRRGRRSRFWAPLLLLLGGCAVEVEETVLVEGRPGAVKTAADARAKRRLFDGAPPVVPHQDFQIDCAGCHDARGMDVAGVGFAPPSPHRDTSGMSAISRCVQCHVFAGDAEPLVANAFVGMRQDLRRGARLNALAPPTIPHKTFMRENCLACHSGPAAREEVRTDHPERVRCRQCHVPAVTRTVFEPSD